MDNKFQRRAQQLRKVSGSSGLEHTLDKVVKVLSEFGIPHMVGGGYAVQEQGYPRFTQDLDIIVPNVAEAKAKLLGNGFENFPESHITVIDPASGAEVDLLPGGGRPVGQGLPLPMPKQVSDTPVIMPLNLLITTKLSSGRSQDIADVVALIKANSLPRDYIKLPAVRVDYEDAWDTAAAEQAVAGLEWEVPGNEEA